MKHMHKFKSGKEYGAKMGGGMPGMQSESPRKKFRKGGKSKKRG